MNYPKKSPTALRYFFARFPALTKPKWWIPSGLILLGSICAWQYWSHPEWLGANLLNSQPQSSNPDLDGSVGSLLDDPLERLDLDLPDPNLAKPFQNNSPSPSPTSPPNPLASPLSNPLNQGNSNPLTQLTQPLASQGKSQLSSIFKPLIPSFNDTPVPSAAELLKSSASSSSVGQNSGSPLPTVSVTNNPLQEAIRQRPTNLGESGSPGEALIQESQQFSQPQPVVPNYSPPAYNYGGQSVPNYSPPAYNYGGQSVPNYSPPSYNTQPPAATSQPPYANPNYGYSSQPVTPNQPPQANPSRQQQNSPFNAGIYRPF